MNLTTPAFPEVKHDHASCVERCLEAAEQVCRDHQARLTPQRRRVLEILLADHVAVGAYEIVDRLADGGRRPAPTIVYRALDFLIELGLVHRLASLNAFIACGHPGAVHGAQFLICDRCGVVAELADPELTEAVRMAAMRANFAVVRPVVEIAGRCPACRAGHKAPADA